MNTKKYTPRAAEARLHRAYPGGCEASKTPQLSSHPPRLSGVVWLVSGLLATSLVWFSPSEVLADSVEIGGFVGTRFGGSLKDLDAPQAEQKVDMEIADSQSLALSVDVVLTPQLYLELWLSQQQTQLESGAGFLVSGESLTDLNVTYYQLGLNWEFLPGQTRPYLAGGLGVAQFDASAPGFANDSRFAFSLALGLKQDLLDTLALRIEGRLYSTSIESTSEVYCDAWGCYEQQNGSMAQFEFLAGLAFRF